jgi:hypothetical protein
MGNPAGFAPKGTSNIETTRIKKDVYTIAELENMPAKQYAEVVFRDPELENQLNAIYESRRTGQPLPPEFTEQPATPVEAAPVPEPPAEPTPTA